MGLRFRKSQKLAPGIKLNINKKSSSVTFGKKGVHYTINSSGRKTSSIGIPGTGISYTKTTSKKKNTVSKGDNFDYFENINYSYCEILSSKEFSIYEKDTSQGFQYDKDPKALILPNGRKSSILSYKISYILFLIIAIFLLPITLFCLYHSFAVGVFFLVICVFSFIIFNRYKKMVNIHRKIFETSK